MSSNLAVIASVITGITGILMAYAAMKKAEREAKSEGEDSCKEELAKARKEAEEYAAKLHEQKMGELQSGS